MKIIAAALAALLLCEHGTALSQRRTSASPVAIGCFMQNTVGGAGSNIPVANNDPVETCRARCISQGKPFMSFSCAGQGGGQYCNCLTESSFSSGTERPSYECRGECTHSPGAECSNRIGDGSRVDTNCKGYMDGNTRVSEFEGYILGASWRTMIYPVVAIPACFMEGSIGGPGPNVTPENNNPVKPCRESCQSQGKPYMGFSCANPGGSQHCTCLTESEVLSGIVRPSYECRGECTASSSASCSGRSDDGSRVDTNCKGFGDTKISEFEGYILGASWRTMVYPVALQPTASPTSSPSAAPTASPTSSPSTLSPTTSPTTSPSPTLSPTHSPSSSPTYTPRLAKYIKVQLASSGSLSVNEVQVINESSTNVAASSATMSSTDGGNVPANAVDGDTNTAARTLDELMPWLQIELAQETDISKVIIDSDSELSSARISLFDEEGKTVFVAEGSVLAAATNGSGALEINGPDFQNAETSSPSSSPTMSANLATDGSENSLYYPDWTKGNGGCKTGGGQPLYMTNAPTTWMFATLNNCCERYYGWMLDECKGTSGGAPSGLWYPDWAGPDDTCKNDGSEPQYMALNPVAWMHSSKQACCDANFGWMLNECLGSSGPNADANKWFIDWDDSKCKQDCAVGTGPSCGGRAESWEELFDTRSACCSTKAAWNPTCLVD